MKSINAQDITQIPDILFDYWMAILSADEFKVLMCIAASPETTRELIAQKTNVSDKVVSSSIKKLILANLIQKFDVLTKQAHRVFYTLDTDFILTQHKRGD